MILNGILSIGFLIGIRPNVVEGAFLSSLVNGPHSSVHPNAQRHTEALDDLLRLHVSTFLPLADSANLAGTGSEAQKTFKSYLELSKLSATELIQSYIDGSRYPAHLLNMECKRRMDVFMSLFRNEGIITTI